MFKKPVASLLTVVGLGLTVAVLPGCKSSAPFSEYDFDKGRSSFVAGDYHQAFANLEPLAQRGNAEAQYAVGYMYFYGLGTIQDRQTAIRWMQSAAQNGQTQAQQALAALQGEYGNNNGFSMAKPRSFTNSNMRPGLTPKPRGNRYYAPSSGSGLSTANEPPMPENRQLKATWPPPKDESLDYSSHSQLAPPDASPNQVVKAKSTQEQAIDTAHSELKSDKKAVTQAKSSQTMQDMVAKVKARQHTTHKKVVHSDINDSPEASLLMQETQAMQQALQKNLQKSQKLMQQASNNNYTIQLMGAYDIAEINRMIDQHHLQGKVNIYHSTRNGRDWYVLGYGQYPSIKTASSDIKSLPSPLQAERPWVRNTRRFQQPGLIG